MRLSEYECKTTFWEDFTIAEMFGEEAIRDAYWRVKAEWGTIVYTEQNPQWCLTINVGIGTKNGILNLADFTLGCGKNITSGCWRIGKARILSAI